MDVMTIRFIIIFLIVVTGLCIIPGIVFFYWVRKYDNRGKWWMFPTTVIYLVLFFCYAPNLIPEKWTLQPVEVYQCEWQTKYIPKS